VRSHAAAGYEMLCEEGVHSFEILDVVRFHHERLDGSGYPYALKNEQINQNVRIIMICDIYAALRENRPYNRPMDWVAALKRMSEKCSRIDMGLFKIFMELAISIETKHELPESMSLAELRIATVP
jgi:HD-GYP domain-containing protein (c-di-GMP phosphodiesterase class II)